MTSNDDAPVARGRGRPRAPTQHQRLWDLLGEIESDPRPDGTVTFFRGHGSFRYKLRPSLFRDVNSRLRTNESRVIRELIARHPQEFYNDSSVFENLVRMQHYGLPTRLLDLTQNPLVAAFFACELDSRDTAEVIAITINFDRLKSYDSDTVHCVANLANLKASEKVEIRGCPDDATLRASNAGTRLFDFVVQKRPNFSNRIVRSHLSDFFVVSPKLSNPRIIAQSGAFLIFGLEEELRNTAGIDIKKYRIQADRKADFRDTLNLLGINGSSVYPGLDRSILQMKDRYLSSAP